MKTVAKLALVAVMATGLQAGSMSFIGVEGGKANVKGSGAGREDDNIYGIRLGAVEGDWRGTLLGQRHKNSDEDIDIKMVTMVVDNYLTHFGVDQFRASPFIGFHGGYVDYEVGNIDDSGWAYGVQAGLSFGLGDVAELDFTYRYSHINSSNLDYLDSYTVGLNIFF